MIVIYRIKFKLLGMTVIILQNWAPAFLSNLLLTTSPTLQSQWQSEGHWAGALLALCSSDFQSPSAWNTCSLFLLPSFWLGNVIYAFKVNSKPIFLLYLHANIRIYLSLFKWSGRNMSSYNCLWILNVMRVT